MHRRKGRFQRPSRYCMKWRAICPSIINYIYTYQYTIYKNRLFFFIHQCFTKVKLFKIRKYFFLTSVTIFSFVYTIFIKYKWETNSSTRLSYLFALFWQNICTVMYIQSAKILLLPPKYEIIMVPSNHSFFQYCDSNIGFFSIAPCKVITLNPFCILFGISSLLLSWWIPF